MCAIVDNSARDEVFGGAESPAGEFFFTWLTKGKGRLVVGGKLRDELSGNQNFVQWLRQAVQAGRARILDDKEVNTATCGVLTDRVCRSDDPHVIALARISGTRLLYTNDNDLEGDFKRLIPRGIVFTTKQDPQRQVTKEHRSLLSSRRRICNC